MFGFCKAGIQKIGDRDTRKSLISPESNLSICRQCDLLGISSSSYYYKPKGESPENQEIMKEIDKIHMDHPTMGIEGLTQYLIKQDYKVNVKRIRRLHRQMGLKTIYPQKHLSTPGAAQYIKPYLLRNLTICRPNQVWSIDISYIPMARGFVYLTAIIDVYSRYLVDWEISNSLGAANTVSLLQRAIAKYGAPEIINSDQGSQFTCKEWAAECAAHPHMRVSMDGKGRCKDNIWIERFFRSIKYDYIYCFPADTVSELVKGIAKYVKFYNNDRPHQGIHNQIPRSLYQAAA